MNGCKATSAQRTVSKICLVCACLRMLRLLSKVAFTISGHDVRQGVLTGYPTTYPNNGNRALTHFLMKHLERSGNQKKKTHFSWVFFFLPAFGRYCAFGAPPPNWIALPPRPASHSRLDRRCAYPRIALTDNREYGR